MFEFIYDFLTLKIFITPYIILLVYWAGAFGVPLAAWLLTWWFVNSHWVVTDTVEAGKQLARKHIPKPYRVLASAMFLFLFVSLEILWRMVFEFIIAYYQIRDALMELAY